MSKNRNRRKEQTTGVKNVGQLDQDRSRVKSALPEVITTDEDYIDNDTSIPETDEDVKPSEITQEAMINQVTDQMALLTLAKDTIEKQEQLLNLLQIDSATLVDGIQRIAQRNVEKPDETITGILEVIGEYFNSEDYKKQVELLKEM